MTPSNPDRAVETYPAWICADCGRKHGRIINPRCATFHEGDSCGWCGKVTITTEPRDYGYPPILTDRKG